MLRALMALGVLVSMSYGADPDAGDPVALAKAKAGEKIDQMFTPAYLKKVEDKAKALYKLPPAGTRVSVVVNGRAVSGPISYGVGSVRIGDYDILERDVPQYSKRAVKRLQSQYVKKHFHDAKKKYLAHYTKLYHRELVGNQRDPDTTGPGNASSRPDVATKAVVRPPKSLKTTTVSAAKIPMVFIPPGTFQMGSKASETEQPAHRVTLAKGFWIGQTEVTQFQYKALMGANPSFFKGDSLPVEQVSLNDAVEFCNKLTSVERAAGRLPDNEEFRLPTEAEWEYCCRAGSRGDFPSSGEKPSVYANYDSSFHSVNATSVVAHRRPNAWGIYDMHGNVWELCLDDWHPNYDGAPTNGTSWKTDTKERYPVHRGGSWNFNEYRCTATSRSYGDSAYKSYSLGFRVVRSIKPEADAQ